MDVQVPVMAPHSMEVPVIEADTIRQLRELAAMKWGARRIAKALGIHRDTVRRYLRGGDRAEVQTRPAARCLDEAGVARAHALFAGAAEGNAMVVRDLLRDEGYRVSLRTVQRTVQGERQRTRAAQLATVRVETEPGRQMQIDFGQKMVRIGAQMVRVFLLVAVLGFSRRLFVKAFLAERGDDWREGIADAFRHFGGVPHELLGDNASALVTRHDRAVGVVVYHPAYLAFCKDWGVIPRACAPYRARTKGKTESGVKFVKRNAIAGRAFESFAALEAHLSEWMLGADMREHGTTHERPMDRFERAERAALRALPARPLPTREQRLRRRVSNDAFVDVDTVRYSVPHRLIGLHVEVAVGEAQVRVFRGTELVAEHTRRTEPHARVEDPAHRAGLLRSRAETPDRATLAALGRSLADYENVVAAGGAR